MRIHERTFKGNLRRCDYESPAGLLTLVVSERGIRALMWEGEDPGHDIESLTSADSQHLLHAETALQQLKEYFRGERTAFDIELDMVGTPFQQEAWKALRAIPYGATVSYAEQARQLGSSRLARAVGGANRKNPVSIIVPCHRVIGKSGALTGFAGGLGVKERLLGLEKSHRP